MTAEIKTQRFSLCGEAYIVDKLNSANNGNGHYFRDEPADDMHLRECVLRRRLSNLVNNLITNNNRMSELPNGEQYQPRCDENSSLWWALFATIRASHLNTLPVEFAIQHRFNGDMKRNFIGWQHSTSLSLFVDDVERLLRDLYGEADIRALDRVRDAVFVIAEEFTRYIRKDLWQEHGDAQAIDYVRGIGLPEGCCLSGSDHAQANHATRDLALRARAVRANPSVFGKYTLDFLKVLEREWPSFERPPEWV